MHHDALTRLGVPRNVGLRIDRVGRSGRMSMAIENCTLPPPSCRLCSVHAPAPRNVRLDAPPEEMVGSVPGL